MELSTLLTDCLKTMFCKLFFVGLGVRSLCSLASRSYRLSLCSSETNGHHRL